MDTKTVFSTKAEKYAKYRWDYAPQAIAAIFEIAQLAASSSVADIGAGTGILTKHFAEKVQKIYAIEPNPQMRQIATYELSAMPSVSVIDSSAEATNLPDQAVDLISVAQAIHWFEPELTKREMQRILKKDGWLVILRNFGTDDYRNKAIRQLMTEEFGADFSIIHQRPEEKPVRFYFGTDDYQKLTFPFQSRQNWEQFMGAIVSSSFMPDEDSPFYAKLESEAKKVFAQYSADGTMVVHAKTELHIGQPSW